MSVRGAPRRGRRLAVLAVVLVLVAAVLVVQWSQPYGISLAHPLGRARDAADGPPHNGSATATATVVRRSLSSRTTLSGTLGYAGSRTVVNRARGTLTWLPGVGAVVREGQVLYRVDGTPVILLYGRTPAYRDLARGAKASDVTGPDVRELNRALAALGYPYGLGLDTSSDRFSWATEVAVKRLQDHLGVTETGRLALGQVVFLPTALRVTAVRATLGADAVPGAAVLTATSTRRQVVVDLDTTRRSEVRVGDKVTITLPDGHTTPGRVRSIGRVARSGKSGTTVTVSITPTRPRDTGRLDKASVQATITTVTAKHALVVPVEALLALAGGGYAVEVVPPTGTHRLVPVTLGPFDEDAGLVRVAGNALHVGQHVVVPAT